ncbi:MAG: prepilin-type N-terminal cleavage/methylation domain-containing protein [Candidatus Aureabacteria bacterium]|nr:prepilin-type N-terminal cleavage/methylation domain-containing protein [Candidatus Auribacterota bacterium]
MMKIAVQPMLSKNRHHGRNGFTLVEVLISMAVFAVCIPVLVAAMLFCYGTLKINAHKLIALNFAQKKAENLMNIKFPNLSTGSGSYNENNVLLDSAAALRCAIGVVVTADGTKRKRIAVNVSWTEQRRSHSVVLSTVVSDNYVTKPG